jgi:hypothetical protein
MQVRKKMTNTQRQAFENIPAQISLRQLKTTFFLENSLIALSLEPSFLGNLFKISFG